MAWRYCANKELCGQHSTLLYVDLQKKLVNSHVFQRSSFLLLGSFRIETIFYTNNCNMKALEPTDHKPNTIKLGLGPKAPVTKV